jgi:3-deoxy-D-manno-octulosonate 8-phosphate phosphatase (KDO 8-P phosphatase)
MGRAEALAERCRRVKLVLTDVDGVMTDGTVLFLPGGVEARGFHVRDGLGIVLAQRAGVRVGIVSGRSSADIEQRARELGIGVVHQGVADKAEALHGILAAEGLGPAEVAYIGDDVNDLSAMRAVGLSAAPADAAFEARAQADMVLQAGGGRGCLREFLEAILRARGDWERVAETEPPTP